jgi:hypothetical protein
MKKTFKDYGGNIVTMIRDEEGNTAVNGDKILLKSVRENMAADAGVTEGDIEDRVMFYAGYDITQD